MRPAALTPRQLEMRRSALGASEIPIALGLSRWTHPATLAAMKRGELPPFAGNAYTRWGQRLERVIADEWTDLRRSEGREDLAIFTPGTIRHPASAVVVASPDRVVVPRGRRARSEWISLLEIKTASQYRAAEWGDEASDIPEAYAIQIQVQLEVCGLENATLVTLIGGSDYREHPQVRDHSMGADLVAFAERWWQNHVVQGLPVPLDGSDAATDYLRARYPREIGPMLAPTAAAIHAAEALRAAKTALAVAKVAEADAANRLRDLIGDAAGIEGICTWRANRDSARIAWEQLARSTIDAARLTQVLPRFTATTPGARSLRLTKET